jgi:hypothetical protein
MTRLPDNEAMWQVTRTVPTQWKYLVKTFRREASVVGDAMRLEALLNKTAKDGWELGWVLYDGQYIAAILRRPRTEEDEEMKEKW